MLNEIKELKSLINTYCADDKTYKVKNSTYGLFNENTTITIANYGEYYLLVD